jgi:hypothetical protein
MTASKTTPARSKAGAAGATTTRIWLSLRVDGPATATEIALTLGLDEKTAAGTLSNMMRNCRTNRVKVTGTKPAVRTRARIYGVA